MIALLGDDAISRECWSACSPRLEQGIFLGEDCHAAIFPCGLTID